MFGPGGDGPLDAARTSRLFSELSDQIEKDTGRPQTVEAVADGFLQIAVQNMANAIKKISVQRGYDVTEYTLACFGGAARPARLPRGRQPRGGEGVDSSVCRGLSAFGIGLADVRVVRDRAVEAPLSTPLLEGLEDEFGKLGEGAADAVRRQGVPDDRIEVGRRLHVRYRGSDTSLEVPGGELSEVVAAFEATHLARFGFLSSGTPLEVESLQVEAVGHSVEAPLGVVPVATEPPTPLRVYDTYMDGTVHRTPFYERDVLPPDHAIVGPAVIIEANSTIVVEPGWQAAVTPSGDVVMDRVVPRPRTVSVGTDADPVTLEIFNNLFMNIAEQMGSWSSRTRRHL